MGWRHKDSLRLLELDPWRACTSEFLCPPVHAAVRCLLATYCVTVLAGSIAFMALQNKVLMWPYYITNLSFLGLTAYMTMAAFHTVALARRPFAYDHPPTLRAQTAFLISHQCLYVTVVGLHIAVPLIYWVMLRALNNETGAYFEWINASVHGVNFLVVLLEVLLGRMVLRLRDIWILGSTALLYTCWMWIVNAFAGVWVYPFLSWNRGPMVAISYLSILACLLVCYVLMYLLHQIRERCVGDRARGSVRPKPCHGGGGVHEVREVGAVRIVKSVEWP